MPAQQSAYFLLTIPHHHFVPHLPDGIKYIKGQLENSNQTNYLHWQITIASESKATLRKIKTIFGDECHVEHSKSKKALEYVWKDDTAVENTRFELGELPVHRDQPKDWDRIGKVDYGWVTFNI